MSDSSSSEPDRNVRSPDSHRSAASESFPSSMDEMLTPPGALPVRCPHCLNQTLVAKDKPLREARCVSCGSMLGLTDETAPGGKLARGSGARGGQNIGHFKLLDRLGAGGFGEVWKAQDEQLDRTVAIKLPHQGRLGPEETEKFLREARAAAQLRHPNIVSVHEVGLEGEFLYIVSDFIEGQPLDKSLADQRPGFHDSALLCVKIADALHQAHEEGIIHRDLKPSNIMIDCGGEPHLTDFGLAKRQAGEMTMTIEGQILGTPGYMSPEQAAGSAHTADRRTDVYSLGVILFELLTGELPFRGNWQMLLKQVIEDEPPSPRKFNGHIPRDLETICLKCLQKEPARRYGSAKAFSEELNRYLSGRPIEARPVGSLERVGRWCRRNPFVAGAALVASLCLLLALAATSLGYLWTSRALEETRQAQSRAEANLQQARQAVDDLFTRVSEDALLNQPGMQSLRGDLLRRARDYYERFLVQSGGDESVSDELALAHFRVGLITEEIESPGKALSSYDSAKRIQEQLLDRDPRSTDRLKALSDTLNAIGRSLLKQQRLDKALEAYAAAISVREKLVSLAPHSKEFKRMLANSWMNTALAEKDRNAVRAREHMEKAQAIRQELIAEGEDNPKVSRDLAMGYYNLGTLSLVERDIDRAKTSLEQAYRLFQKLCQDEPGVLDLPYQLATVCRLRGDLMCGKGQLDDALPLYAEACSVLESLAAKNPSVTEYQVALAEVHINLAQTEFEQGNHPAALESFTAAEAILAPLVAEHSETDRYRRDFIVALYAAGRLDTDLLRRQRIIETLESLRDNLEQMEKEIPDAKGLREQIDMAEKAIKDLQSPKVE